MCKSLKRFVLILTALCVMLTMTVSPVMGAQYSEADKMLLPDADSSMWEEAPADSLSGDATELTEAEAEQAAPEICGEEQQVPEAGFK